MQFICSEKKIAYDYKLKKYLKEKWYFMSNIWIESF